MSEFDERIDRRSTADVKWNPEGIKHFLRIESDENTLPMWIADMDFRSAPCVVKALQEKAAFGVAMWVPQRPTTRLYSGGRRNATDGMWTKAGSYPWQG